MAAINAYRMDGLGNDFIIIDRRENFIEIKKNKINTLELISFLDSFLRSSGNCNPFSKSVDGSEVGISLNVFI